jgi:hypothetical protein
MKINLFGVIYVLVLIASVIAESEIERKIATLDKAADSLQKSTIKSKDSGMDAEKTTRKMTINADLQVIGGVTCNKVTADSAEISGNVNIARTLKANDIITDKLTTQTLVTEKIVSPTGVLTLAGDLVINSDVLADGITMRGSSLLLEGVKQFALVDHTDFESEASLDGWSIMRLSRCKEGGNNLII